MKVRGMSKGFKKGLLIFLTTISVIVVVFFLILAIALSEDKYTVKTQYGDSFDVSYDGFRDKSILSDPNSRFYLTVNGKLSENDIKCLKKSSALKVYRIKDVSFFKDGNDFDIFDEKTDKLEHSDVVQVIKDNLHCSEAFYKRYKDLV